MSKIEYVRVKPLEEMQVFSKKSEYNSAVYYTDSTRCGWDNNIASVFGKRIKVVKSLHSSNYKVEGRNFFISPDWCNTPHRMSFKTLY